MKKRIHTRSISLLLYIISITPLCAHAINLAKLYQHAEDAGLNAHVLHLALNSYNWARRQGDVNNPNVLTVIDYSLPSTQKRLWVLDLKHSKVLTTALVSHGHKSGYIYAHSFSNSVNSHKTSLGVYATGMHPFYGANGRSLKMRGLEPGINSNALARAIEIHAAAYVSTYDIQKYGRIGRTYGCFALNPHVANRVMNETVGGSILFAYAKQENKDPVVQEE